MGLSSTDPQRIERLGTSGLQIHWADAHESIYSWRQLRSACPCAVCREGLPMAVPADIASVEIKPVGRYALNIRWSDGHTTGIYSFDYLRSLCSCEACQPKQFEEG